MNNDIDNLEFYRRDKKADSGIRRKIYLHGDFSVLRNHHGKEIK